MDTKKESVGPKILTLKEKRARDKERKAQKKYDRALKDRSTGLAESMKKFEKSVNNDASECIEKMINCMLLEDENGFSRYLDRYIKIDEQLHTMIGEKDNWSREKSLETLNLIFKRLTPEINQHLLDQVDQTELKKEVKDEIEKR